MFISFSPKIFFFKVLNTWTGQIRFLPHMTIFIYRVSACGSACVRARVCVSVCMVYRRQRRDVSIPPYTPEETGAISHGIAVVRTWPIGLGSVAADEHYGEILRDHPLFRSNDVSRWPRRNAILCRIIKVFFYRSEPASSGSYNHRG